MTPEIPSKIVPFRRPAVARGAAPSRFDGYPRFAREFGRDLVVPAIVRAGDVPPPPRPA